MLSDLFSHRKGQSLRFVALGMGFITSFSLAGCGKIGFQPKPERVMNFTTGNEGCLNDLGNKVRQYPTGDVDRSEWETAWTCSIDTLKSFQDYVKGTDSAGFTPDDIRALVSKFLITKEPVSREFVAGLFELKSGLLGGDSSVLTYAELDQVVTLFGWARDRSSELIPLLARRMDEQTPQAALELTLAVSRIGDEFAKQLKLDPHVRLPWDLLLDLATQAQSIFGLELNQEWHRWVSPVKRLLLGGDADGIEATRIPDAIRTLGEIVGAALPLISGNTDQLLGPNASAQLLWGVGESLRPTFERSLRLNAGTLPLVYFDQIIDLLPDSIFTTPREMRVDRFLVKKALRIVNWRILKSGRVSSIDLAGLNRLFQLWGFWTRGQTALDVIYENLAADSEGVKLEEFIESAERYSDTLEPSERPEISRLIQLASRFHPIHYGKEVMINFHLWDRYSLGHMSKMHLNRMIAEVIIEGYSTTTDQKTGNRTDIDTLVKDWRDLLVQIHMIDPLDPLVAENRFRDANLFTFMSDGNELVDLDEATYLLNFIASIGKMSDQTIKIVNEPCAILDQPKDSYGWHWMEARCFRKHYFSNVDTIWANFPELLNFYKSLNKREREKVEISLEMGARRLGYSDDPIGMSDLQSFSGLAHYIEALFKRFDSDRSGIINLEELLRAFPVFRGELARFGNIDPTNTSMLEAVFTYLVRFEAPPILDFLGTSHFIAWWGWKPFWTLNGDRKSLFSVLSALNPKGVSHDPVVSENSGLSSWDSVESHP